MQLFFFTRLRDLYNSRITANIFWLVVERFVQIVIGIVISGLFARSLGTDGYGIYQYASAIIVIGLSLTYICGSEVLVPILSNQHGEKTISTLYNAFIIRLFASVVVFIGILVFILTSDFSYDLKMLLGVWGLVIIINEPFGVIKAWMEANTFIKPNVIIRIIALSIKISMVFVFYKLGLPLFYVGLIMFLEAFFTSLGQLAYFRKKFNDSFVMIKDTELIKDLFKKGLFFWIGLVLMFVFTKVDKLILKRFLTFQDLGIYTSAMGITDNFNAMAAILSTSFAPLMIYKEKIIKKAYRNLVKILMVMIASAIVGSLCISNFAEPIIRIIFGTSFSSASMILIYSIWISVLVFSDAALNLIILRNGAFKVIIAKWAFAFLTNSIVIFCSVGRFNLYSGIIGIAAGYLVSILITVVYIVYFYKHFKNNTIQVALDS